MTVITRFAPSPTGFLHIGGARTALFNWLYARHHNGKFLLRIEDTDRERSTQPAIDAIIESMKWLGLDWDGEVIFQFARAPRHAEIAQELLKNGKAYKCYTSQTELEEFRKNNPGAKFISPWRDGGTPPPGAPFVIRIKAPLEGSVTIADSVQGDITVDCKQLDDMVLLRSDGTPTYMHAVVVDDHDMGITQIIRGDDHLTNTFRQRLIYDAMGWEAPKFAHVPMILGADGAKLSKRHGALGVQEYEKMGYLPDAICNYLLRLGWAHGDDEIISRTQAIEWFGLEAIGKSPSRFDFAKLENLNGLYIRESTDAKLLELILPRINERLAALGLPEASDTMKTRLLRGMNGLKQRATKLDVLADSALIYADKWPLGKFDAKATEILDKGGHDTIRAVLPAFEAQAEWAQAALELICRTHAETHAQKLGNVAQPLRAALSGTTVSPPIFEVMEVLGKEETLGRLQNQANKKA